MAGQVPTTTTWFGDIFSPYVGAVTNSCELRGFFIAGFPDSEAATVASVAAVLAINDSSFSAEHLVRNVDLRTFFTFHVSA